MIQLLTPEGQRMHRREDQQYADIAAELSDEDLRGMYRDLVLIRRIDAEANALQRQGELGIWVSLLGQEAAQVGCGRALRPQDYAFPPTASTASRGAGASTRSTCSVSSGGQPRGLGPEREELPPYTIVIGAQALHATGYAMG